MVSLITTIKSTNYSLKSTNYSLTVLLVYSKYSDKLDHVLQVIEINQYSCSVRELLELRNKQATNLSMKHFEIVI